MVKMIADHSLMFEGFLFKWDGKEFHVYEEQEDGSLKFLRKEQKPLLKLVGENHHIRLYNNGNVGFRVYVHSDYKRKNEYIAYPIMYDNGEVAWDNPYSVPKYVQREVIKIMRKLRIAEVL